MAQGKLLPHNTAYHRWFYDDVVRQQYNENSIAYVVGRQAWEEATQQRRDKDKTGVWQQPELGNWGMGRRNR